MAAPNVVKPTASRGRGKWVVLGVLALGVFVAAQAGYVGFAWAQLMATVFPRDEALLGYVAGDAGGLAVVDPHQIELRSLGGESSAAREWLVRTREDIKKVTGIDLALDVDKIVFTPSVTIAKGRFDAKKLAARLADSHYAQAEHKGRGYLVRAGEDAVAVIDDAVLLYGDEAGVKAAIEAKDSGTSLDKNERVLGRLRSIGWDHPLLMSLQLGDSQPSIRDVLLGSAGPRAVTAGVSTKAGLDLSVAIESASPASAAELRKLLEEKRGDAAALTPAVGSKVATIVVDIVKKATIKTAPDQSFVKIDIHVEPAQLDALIKAADTGVPFRELYKNLRLFQLLVPGL